MIKRVAVFCGGDSSEREVSLHSGSAVQAGLRAAGFDSELVDLSSLAQVRTILPAVVRSFDLVFIALHGGWGEDGTVQSALAESSIAYTGSRPAACKLAMRKDLARRVFIKAGISVPRGFMLLARADTSSVMERLGGKVVVKPASGGSTVGVSIVADESELPAAMASAAAYDSRIIVEEYIEGREITAAVLARDGIPQVLPVIEIVPRGGFYDYENKYSHGTTEYLVPAPLTDKEVALVREYALNAHASLGCSVYSRTDLRLSPAGVPYVLEVNTVPGMTDTSLVPKAAAAVGLDFPRLVRQIVQESAALAGDA